MHLQFSKIFFSGHVHTVPTFCRVHGNVTHGGTEIDNVYFVYEVGTRSSVSFYDIVSFLGFWSSLNPQEERERDWYI
jgi:hypothetical protein